MDTLSKILASDEKLADVSTGGRHTLGRQTGCRQSRAIFTRTPFADYIHPEVTRGLLSHGRHLRTTFTGTTTAEHIDSDDTLAYDAQ
jgi:hypothetical protein